MGQPHDVEDRSDTQTLLVRLARVEAHLAITQLAVRYARAVDARDLDTLASLYTPDASFSASESSGGRPAIREYFGNVLTNFYRSMHQICGHVLDRIDDDEAAGTVYCRVEHEDGDDWVVQLMVYFDRYQRVDGEWLFASRRPTYLYTRDERVTPQEVDFNSWPNWEDSPRAGSPAPGVSRRFAPALPQAWPTWNPYWAEHVDVVSARTHRP